MIEILPKQYSKYCYLSEVLNVKVIPSDLDDFNESESILEQLYAQMMGWTELGRNKKRIPFLHRYNCECEFGKSVCKFCYPSVK